MAPRSSGALIRVPRGGATPEFIHTTARWGGQLAPFQDGGHIYIGQAEGSGADLGLLDNRHMLTCAGSRAGKGVSAIIPTLLSYQGNVLVLDIKGENARITAPWRSTFSQVHVLDPFGITNLPDDFTAAYNPLDGIQRTLEEIALVTDGLVVPSSEKDTHWDESAANLLGGIIAHFLEEAANNPARQGASLPVVYDLLKQNRDTVVSTLRESYSYLAKDAAVEFGDKGEGESSSVLSNARKHMRWCASRDMRPTLGHSNFALTDLQAAPVSIYLCLPASHLDTHKRWFRVFLNLAMHAMSQARPAGQLPALFILDEFPILGHMRQIEGAAGLMAGYGLKLWTIIQDIGQLQSLYKERWQTFLGNAGVLQFFGNTDTGTCEYVSKLLGETTLEEHKLTEGVQDRDPRHTKFWERSRLTNVSRQAERQIVPLLRPDEVRFWFAREKNTQIVVVPDALPIKCWRAPYYTHRTFRARAHQG